MFQKKASPFCSGSQKKQRLQEKKSKNSDVPKNASPFA